MKRAAALLLLIGCAACTSLPENTPEEISMTVPSDAGEPETSSEDEAAESVIAADGALSEVPTIVAVLPAPVYTSVSDLPSDLPLPEVEKAALTTPLHAPALEYNHTEAAPLAFGISPFIDVAVINHDAGTDSVETGEINVVHPSFIENPSAVTSGNYPAQINEDKISFPEKKTFEKQGFRSFRRVESSR